MICRCKPDGAAEVDALVARVKAALQVQDDADFVSVLVMELNWRHNAYVELAADQWFGVRVLRYDGAQGIPLISAQCDRIEDGLAACYEALEEGKGAGKPGS